MSSTIKYFVFNFATTKLESTLSRGFLKVDSSLVVAKLKTKYLFLSQ